MAEDWLDDDSLTEPEIRRKWDEEGWEPVEIVTCRGVRISASANVTFHNCRIVAPPLDGPGVWIQRS